MEDMIGMFVDSIPHDYIIFDGSREFQYNTVDSEGWTYWTELGRGNDLALLIQSIDDINDKVTVTFHTGKEIVINHKVVYPLYDMGI